MSNSTDLDVKPSSSREHPPSSYSVKFENLTSLNDDKYESRLFAAGGYNWRLVIYPKGNAKDEGNGFISMYVEIDSTHLTTTTLTEVFAYLKFFIYNKKTEKYFSVKDTEVKRFNGLRTVWGLSRVLPLDVFNDPKNGYIFEGDQCEFGVDVLVAPPLTKWEVVSFNQKFPDPKFSWTLKKFTELDKNLYVSNKFSIGGKEWDLNLYPKGNAKAEGKSLSIYLRLNDSEGLKADEKIYTEAKVRLVNRRGTAHVTGSLKFWFTERNRCRGWNKFTCLDKLREAYLDRKGSLNIEIEFKVVSTTKYSPTI